MSARKNKSDFDFKEVYQQRYETFRHLDRLRWQMMQISVMAASAIFAIAGGNGAQPKWWVFLGVGIILIFSALAMLKIKSGISANASMLQKAGKRLGDDQLPSVSERKNSVAFWIAMAMLLSGITSLCYPLIFWICT